LGSPRTGGKDASPGAVRHLSAATGTLLAPKPVEIARVSRIVELPAAREIQDLSSAPMRRT